MKSEKENVKGLLDKLEVFDQNDERISRQSSAPG